MPDSFDLRVLLCSRSPSAALRALDQPGYSVCAVVSHAAQLCAMLSQIQPHIVLLDDSPVDFSAVLRTISSLLPVTPPRIICRAPVSLPVDAAYEDIAALPQALQTAFSRPLGVLCAPALPDRFAQAQALLTHLGMPSQLLGRKSIALAVCYLSAFSPPTPPLKHWLYPHLAREEAISPAAVERRIRSAIESTWLHGNLQAQSELFGFTVSAERGKPTNAEFLFLLSEHLRRLLL